MGADLTRLQEQAAGLPAVTGEASVKPNHYCLFPAHAPRLADMDRYFYWPDDSPDCPTCPVCGRQVSAQRGETDAQGNLMIPRNIQEITARIGE